MKLPRRNWNAGVTLFELLFGLAIVAIALSFLFTVFKGCTTYSEGRRVGNITKFSLKGAVFKTWEGELSMGGIRRDADGGVALNVWAFTVASDRKDLIDTIQKAMDHNQTVRIKYEEKGWRLPNEGDTRYRIKDVIIVSPAPQ